jgi:hypothetical protein
LREEEGSAPEVPASALSVKEIPRSRACRFFFVEVDAVPPSSVFENNNNTIEKVNTKLNCYLDQRQGCSRRELNARGAPLRAAMGIESAAVGGERKVRELTKYIYSLNKKVLNTSSIEGDGRITAVQ